MFCWCYYAHITRIARCPLLGPVGLVPENERRQGGRDSKERMEGGGGKQTCQKTAVWQNDRFCGFICGVGGGEDTGLAVGMQENWSNQALMCSGSQTLH